MKIIKYETEREDYCLVHKTSIYIYYLIYKNKEYYYYESCKVNMFNRKTKKICEKLLRKKIIKISSERYSDVILSFKIDNYKNKNDYHIMSSTFGDGDYKTLYLIDKNLNEIASFKGQRYSPTFLFSYILYKFGYDIPIDYHSFIGHFVKEIDKNDEKKIKKYAGIMYYRFSKFNFIDINANFELFEMSYNKRYLFKFFTYYDNIININKKRIISFFKVDNDEDKKLSYLAFGMSYFASLFYIDLIKKNNIKNSKISINACLFKYEKCKNFFNDSNMYYFSDFNNLKNGWMLFIDDKYNEFIKLIKNKFNKQMLKRILNVKKLYF